MKILIILTLMSCVCSINVKQMMCDICHENSSCYDVNLYTKSHNYNIDRMELKSMLPKILINCNNTTSSSCIKAELLYDEIKDCNVSLTIFMITITLLAFVAVHVTNNLVA